MPAAVQPNLHRKSASNAAPSTRVPRKDPPTSIGGSLQLVPQPQQSRRLALLMKLRKISTPTAVLLVLGILPLYAWSVSTQLSWGKRYQHLDQLRRTERELQAKTETMKHDVTQDAMQNAKELVPQGPSNNLFLPAMSPRPNTTVVTPAAVQPNPAASAPLAY
jgi:C4-dicarboxylate-specific signal transduction histidine kinase